MPDKLTREDELVIRKYYTDHDPNAPISWDAVAGPGPWVFRKGPDYLPRFLSALDDLRTALGMPNASIEEMCERIRKMQTGLDTCVCSGRFLRGEL